MTETTGLTIDEVTAAFNDAGLTYSVVRSDVVSLGFGGLSTYRNTDGEPKARVFVDVSSHRLKFIMLMAWCVPEGDHRSAVLETCLRLQWQYFGIRFEFDHHDGELRAVFDFHVHAVPAASHVADLIRLFIHMVETVHPAIQAAIDDGVVYERPADEVVSAQVRELVDTLSELSPEQIRTLLAAVCEEVPE